MLPSTAKEKPQEGEILAVGPGKVMDNGKRTSLEVGVGQKVLFAKYAGSESIGRRRRFNSARKRHYGYY